MEKICLLALFVLVGCSPVPDDIDGKLLCLHENGTAYMANKYVGDSMTISRVEYDDSICKEME